MPLPSPDNDYLVARTHALTEALFNAVFGSVGSRLRIIEAQRQDLQAVIDAGTAQAIAAVQNELAPYAADAQSKAAQIAAYLAAYQTNANPLIEAVLSAVLGSVESRGDTLAKLLALIDAANAVLATKAPLDSPPFTGNPTAPTPAGGDNTTKVATTAFVQAAINTLLNGAPGALDTLKELADALGDDANFSTTVMAALANRLRFDAAQSLSSGEKTQAQANLGLGAMATRASVLAGDLPAGPRVLLASYVASNSGALGAANVFSAGGFAHYEIELLNLVSSVDGNIVFLQLSPNGSGFLTDANYEFAGLVVNAGGVGAQAFSAKNAIEISRSGGYNSNGGGARGLSGLITIPKLAAAANEFLKMTFQIAGADTSVGGGLYSLVQAGQYRNSGAMAATGFQLFPNAGNLTSGVVNVYGYN